MKQSNVIVLITSLTVSLLFSCSGQSDNELSNSFGPWTISINEVFDGGPGKDGIPSIDNPQFSSVAEVDFLAPSDLVLGLKVGDEIRAYPHPILDWHEIVNDEVNGKALAITYCPLTGTGSCWNREVLGAITSFGVSGLLYNSNLIPYDRKSDSNWSQLLMKSVNGTHTDEEIETYPMIETTWETWQEMYPMSRVLNTQTGFNRNYSFFPYGGYKTNHDQLLFPVAPLDDRLPAKQRGLGIIINEQSKFYPLSKFDSPLTLTQEEFNLTDIVVVGSNQQNILVAYERRLPDGTLLTFFPLANIGDPVIMEDTEGNRWNIFGEAVSGPRKNTVLVPIRGCIGYWFSFGAFYPEIEIY